jgi:hypothetical protein
MKSDYIYKDFKVNDFGVFFVLSFFFDEHN